MPGDSLPLDEWLSELGYDSPDTRERALGALRDAGVLSGRPRQAIAAEKQARAEAALEAAFIIHCSDPSCRKLAGERAAPRGSQPIATQRRAACEICQGANTRRAFERASTECLARGVTRWLVVGGSPNLRGELKELLKLAPGLEVDLDDGSTGDSRAKLARGRRAQAIAILGSSQINHKDTAIYTSEFRERVIEISTRSLERLFEAMERHAKGKR